MVDLLGIRRKLDLVGEKIPDLLGVNRMVDLLGVKKLQGVGKKVRVGIVVVRTKKEGAGEGQENLMEVVDQVVGEDEVVGEEVEIKVVEEDPSIKDGLVAGLLMVKIIIIILIMYHLRVTSLVGVIHRNMVKMLMKTPVVLIINRLISRALVVGVLPNHQMMDGLLVGIKIQPRLR